MLERHQLSAVWGDIDESQLGEFIADIRDNDLKDKTIVTYDGKVLDGWHRYTAAIKLGFENELNIVPLSSSVDPIEYVISKNAHRRHLSASARAAAIVSSLEYRDQLSTVGRPSGERESMTTAEIAEAHDVSTTAVRRAREIDDEARQRVVDGESSLQAEHAAAREQRRQERESTNEPATTDVDASQADVDPEQLYELCNFDIDVRVGVELRFEVTAVHDDGTITMRLL